MKYNCTIIGAGAAGLFYAAADTTPGNKIILEKTSRPGQKLLLSGSGMCNITHGGSIKNFISKYGDDGSKIRTCLYKHNNLEMIKFFKDAGVDLNERPDGKIFPASLQARDILDSLLAKSAEWQFRYNAEVVSINASESPVNDASSAANTKNDTVITLKLKSGELIETEKLIVATGGASYPATGSDGSFMSVLANDLSVKTVDLQPALTPVYVQNYPYSELSGISFENVRVSCSGNTVTGPMLFTHRCFSGPAILHISRYVKTGKILHINFLPDLNTAQVFQKLKEDQPGNSRGISNYLSTAFALPKAFTDTMFADPSRKFSTVGHKELENVCHLMTDRKFSVSGTGGWNEAMVTSGGVSLDEINTKNMSLKNYPAIHVIGEALDVCGDTGGYNLQFAWSSAIAAFQ